MYFLIHNKKGVSYSSSSVYYRNLVNFFFVIFSLFDVPSHIIGSWLPIIPPQPDGEDDNEEENIEDYLQ